MLSRRKPGLIVAAVSVCAILGAVIAGVGSGIITAGSDSGDGDGLSASMRRTDAGATAGLSSSPAPASNHTASASTPAVSISAITDAAMAASRATARGASKATSLPKPMTSSPASGTGGQGAGTGRIRYGTIYHGTGTFYAATGAGNCMYDATSDLMVGAMNQQDYDHSQSCGASLAVTGPNGTTITIKVVDRCPECPPGAIDLSREAFTKLAPAQTGLIAISWKLLSPDTGSTVSYRYKSGSSQYWCGIQVLDHRNPVHTLELKTGSTWTAIQRQDYNYFVSQSGAGCGGSIRITDIYGNRLTGSGITIRPDAVQRGHAQFPQR